MTYTTLISAQELATNLTNPNWVVVDCRFSLDDTEQRRRDYQESHIAGAVYAHLDEDLSGPIIPGQTGRHPLPEVDTFVQTLSNWGIDNTVQVVAYDAFGGAIAARLWWMLHWLGHKAGAVLDGGWPGWQNEGGATNNGVETKQSRSFSPVLHPELVLTAAEIDKIRTDSTYRLFDSRSADRYRGENETLDPIAGRIPGAISLPFDRNWDSKKLFLPIDELKAHIQTQLGDTPSERTVFYCGSGVTAAHNILALAYAGLGEARLYAGSWSEWITDPARPVATG